MKPYNELTHRGKMRRMGRLAQAALEAYGLADAPLRLFLDNGNIIYRVKGVQAPSLAPVDDAKALFFNGVSDVTGSAKASASTLVMEQRGWSSTPTSPSSGTSKSEGIKALMMAIGRIGFSD